jgi:acyl carrier protein
MVGVMLHDAKVSEEGVVLPVAMNDEEILKAITKYLVEDFEISAEKISLDANLFTDLELDSVDALDWFATMETEINLSIVERDLKKIRTVRDVIAYVKKNGPAD